MLPDVLLTHGRSKRQTQSDADDIKDSVLCER